MRQSRKEKAAADEQSAHDDDTTWMTDLILILSRQFKDNGKLERKCKSTYSKKMHLLAFAVQI